MANIKEILSNMTFEEKIITVTEIIGRFEIKKGVEKCLKSGIESENEEIKITCIVALERLGIA